MLLDGLRYAVLKDPDRKVGLKVMYPSPLPGNPWGVLLPVKESSWGEQIPIVSGEALSHALHGYVRPLREMLGNPPVQRARMVPLEDRLCYESQAGICQMASPQCHPGSQQMPECYVAPTEDRALRTLGTAIAQAWEEDRYVFVVEGPEFVVT